MLGQVLAQPLEIPLLRCGRNLQTLVMPVNKPRGKRSEPGTRQEWMQGSLQERRELIPPPVILDT